MRISASILACNPLKLEECVKETEASGADIIHIDIMDGHYVKNFTFGINTVYNISKITKLPIDVHLEIYNPERYIKDFADAGAKIVTVQLDTCKHPIRTLNSIKSYNIKAGLAINPHLGLESVKYLLNHIDYLLLMAVEPGFGGQRFNENIMEKIIEARSLIDNSGKDIYLCVDGGISLENVRRLKEAGAEVLIIGTGLYKKDNLKKNILSIRNEIKDIS